MRRMLLVACAVGLCGIVAAVAFAADSPIAQRPSAPTPGGTEIPAPDSGPFALAASRAQSEASAERHRAARESYDLRHRYDGYDGGEYRPSTAPRPWRSRRVRVIGGMAERLDIGRRTMWRAVLSVRRQISPREWSDARGEALRMLARELDRPVADVERAVRLELREELSAHKGYGVGYEGGR